MGKKEKEEMIRWLRDRDAGMLLLGIAHLGKMVEFMNSDTSELDKNIKKSTDILVDYIFQELDKAREEGKREAFTKDEWLMLKLAMNDIFNKGNTAYEEISEKIEELSKLKSKEDGK